MSNFTWTDNLWSNSGVWIDNGWGNSNVWIDSGWGNGSFWVDSGWGNGSWDNDTWSDYSSDDSWVDWSDWSDTTWNNDLTTTWNNDNWSNTSWSDTSFISSLDWDEVHNVVNVIGVVMSSILLFANMFFIVSYAIKTSYIQSLFVYILSCSFLAIGLLVLWIKPIRKLIITNVILLGFIIWTTFNIIGLF